MYFKLRFINHLTLSLKFVVDRNPKLKPASAVNDSQILSRIFGQVRLRKIIKIFSQVQWLTQRLLGEKHLEKKTLKMIRELRQR